MNSFKQHPSGVGGPGPASVEPGRSGGWWRPVVLIVAIAALLAAARVLGLGDRLGDLKEWIARLGPLGPLVYVLIYVAATVAKRMITLDTAMSVTSFPEELTEIIQRTEGLKTASVNGSQANNRR